VLLFLYEKLFPKKQDPIVKDLQVNDSYVFLSNKMRMRGSFSSHPASDNPIASAHITSGARSPKYNPHTNVASGYLSKEGVKSQRRLHGKVNLSTTDTMSKSKIQFGQNSANFELWKVDETNAADSSTKMIANNFKKLQKNIKRPVRI
jgi:hypothetical protein